MTRILIALLTIIVSLSAIDVVQASILDQKYSLFTPQGLSSGTAYRSVRDKEGFMWFSTRNGIDRFDGSQFRHYRLNGNDRRGIHDGMMIYLYKDENDELWVYTERSIIYHYNPLTDTFEEALTFPPEDGVGSVEDMCVWGDEIIFAVSNGLMSYDVKNGMTRTGLFLTDRDVRCIAPYTDGCLLIGTNKGLAVYDPVQHRVTTVYDQLFVDVKSICYNPADHTIWVGSYGQGLYFVDEDNGRFTRVGNQQFVVHSMCLYDKEEVLVGTDGDGLQMVRRTPTGYELMQLACDTPDAIYPIHCSCVRHVVIEDDRIWLSMHFGGVVSLQPSNSMVEMFNPVAKTPADSYVFGASFDSQGRAWVAFNQAIGCFETDGTLQGLYLDHQARYLAVHASPDGTIWCGGFNTGTYHFDPVTGRQEFFPSVRGSSTLDCVYAFHTDTRGYTWVGGLDFGLTCIVPTQPRQIGDDPHNTLKFEHTSIRQVCDIDQLDDSTLAVATSDGLYLYNYYTHRQEHLFLVDDEAEWQGTNFFTSITVRHGHEIWLATDGAGLLCHDLRTGQTLSFGLEHGLPSLELRGVSMANDSTLCVASELNGIFAFDCKNHLFLHSVWHSEGSQFQQNSITSNGQGLVVAGCNQCAVLVGNDDIEKHFTEAVIHIDGHPIINGSITLPSDAPDLRLSFATSDIYHQSEYHFFYRINGIDKDWIHLDDQRRLEYHKMPAGTYTLDVVAYGPGGQKVQRTVSIVVDRSFLSILPYLVIVAVILILLFALHKARAYRSINQQ